MKSKEWREVALQVAGLFIFEAAMYLFLALGRLVWPDRNPIGEQMLVVHAVALVMFLSISGLAAFASERGQGAMEYALSLPLARRRLLWSKFLPRLCAALVLISWRWLFVAEQGGLPEFSTVLFVSLLLLHLFLVSFSLSTTSRNFVALFFSAWFWFFITTLAASFMAALAFQLKPGRVYSMPLGEVLRMTANPFRTESWLSRGGLATVAPLASLLLAMPLALFLAFPRFDTRPRSGFNRRLAAYAAPLLLLGLGLGGLISCSLWITPDVNQDFWLTADRQLVEFKFPAVTVRGQVGEWSIRTPLDLLPLHEENGWIYAGGYGHAWDDPDNVSYVRLSPSRKRIEILYTARAEGLFRPLFQLSIGSGKLCLATKVEVGGKLRVGERVRDGRLAIVEVDLETKQSTRTTFCDPQLDGLYAPRVVATGEIAGSRFWLVQSIGTLLRLHRDGRVETLVRSPGQGGTLLGGDRYLVAGKGALRLYRLTPAGAVTEREFPGEYRLPWRMRSGSIPAEGPLLLIKRPRITVSFDPATGVITELDRGDRFQLEYTGDSGTYFSERALTRTEGAGLRDWQKVTLLKLDSGRLVKIGEFPSCNYFRVTPGGLVVSRRGRVAGYELPALKEMTFYSPRE